MEKFDVIVEAETELEIVLRNVAEVDGHDFCSGEANIFILTSQPIESFNLAKPLLQQKCLFSGGFRAAFRPVNSNSFTVVWPESSGGFSVA